MLWEIFNDDNAQRCWSESLCEGIERDVSYCKLADYYTNVYIDAGSILTILQIFETDGDRLGHGCLIDTHNFEVVGVREEVSCFFFPASC